MSGCVIRLKLQVDSPMNSTNMLQLTPVQVCKIVLNAYKVTNTTFRQESHNLVPRASYHSICRLQY